MKKIVIEGIKDFKMCERLYDYRYEQLDNHGGPIGYRDLLASRYSHMVKKVAYYFFYKKMEGKAPSYRALMNRWEKIWFKDTDLFDITNSSLSGDKETLVTLNTDATMILMDMHESWEKIQEEPIGIALDTIVPVNDSAYISYNIDLLTRSPIGENGGHTYRAYYFYINTKKPDFGTMLLDFAGMRKSFEYRNGNKLNKNDVVEYRFYDFGSQNRDSKMANIKVEDSDLDDLNYWANKITYEEIFPSRRGLTVACKTCPFDKQCKEWTVKQEEIEWV